MLQSLIPRKLSFYLNLFFRGINAENESFIVFKQIITYLVVS